MEAFVWIAHTLEVAFLACFVVVVLGLFALVVRASRLARNSQAQREANFLACHATPPVRASQMRKAA